MQGSPASRYKGRTTFREQKMTIHRCLQLAGL
jgi:hypothetical protein